MNSYSILPDFGFEPKRSPDVHGIHRLWVYTECCDVNELVRKDAGPWPTSGTSTSNLCQWWRWSIGLSLPLLTASLSWCSGLGFVRSRKQALPLHKHGLKTFFFRIGIGTQPSQYLSVWGTIRQDFFFNTSNYTIYRPNCGFKQLNAMQWTFWRMGEFKI